MFTKIKEWLFGPHKPEQVQTVAANTVAVQAQGSVTVSVAEKPAEPAIFTLPVSSPDEILAKKEWPFPGYEPTADVGKELAEAAKAADAAAPAKKPRKPRAKKAK